MPNLPDAVNDLDQTLGEADYSEYVAAAAEAREASQKIVNGAAMIDRGDTMGGAAALLEGIGQFISVGASFMGPMGALAGGLFSMLTGIISAIMEALAPQQKALEARIKDIIESDDMKQLRAMLPSDDDLWTIMTGGWGGGGTLDKMALTRKAAADAKKAGTPFVFDGQNMRWPSSYDTRFGTSNEGDVLAKKVDALADGLTWDEVKAETDPESHIGKVVNVVNQLQTYRGLQDEQWSALLDETVGYLYRDWISLHQLEGLVNQGALGRLQDMLLGIAKTQKPHLDAMSYAAQNNCTFYARWHTNAGGGADVYDWWYEPFYRRNGVIKSTDDWKEMPGGKTSNFQVSSGGTVFAVNTDVNQVNFGRGELMTATGGPPCVEVFIGDAPGFGGQVIVGATDISGRALSISGFDDSAPFMGGDADQWVAHQERWGPWHTIPFNFRVGSVAFVPTGGGRGEYAIYVLAMRDEFDVILYSVSWDGACTPVEGFYWSNDDVRAAMGWNLYHSQVADGNVTNRWWGSADQETHKASLSCAISLSPLAVQVGNSVKFAGGSQWDVAAPNFIASGGLRTHQGRFSTDGTFVLCSNQGLHMRYWDAINNVFQWVHDEAVETECIHKVSPKNGAMYRALQTRFGEVISQNHG